MADYGIKVSKEGFDVRSAADKNLIMSSKFNMLKTKETGVFNGAGTQAHGLGYNPVFLNFRETSSGVVNIGRANGGSDATNLTFEGTNNKRYYVFYQEL